jgi:hypothetical protein
MNGKFKVGVSIAGILALLTITFYAGGTWTQLNNHVNRSDIHQGREIQERTIDGRIDPEIALIQLQLDEINKKLDRRLTEMDKKLDRLLEEQP